MSRRVVEAPFLNLHVITPSVGWDFFVCKRAN